MVSVELELNIGLFDVMKRVIMGQKAKHVKQGDKSEDYHKALDDCVKIIEELKEDFKKKNQ